MDTLLFFMFVKYVLKKFFVSISCLALIPIAMGSLRSRACPDLHLENPANWVGALMGYPPLFMKLIQQNTYQSHLYFSLEFFLCERN